MEQKGSEDKQRYLHHVIRSLEVKALNKRSFALKFADEMTTFFGSMPFLIINILIFILWILINTGKIPGVPVFDKYPFTMLTTMVSLEAIMLTVIVLMSQNRQSLISSLREEVDIQVNLIAEREITKTLKLLSLLLEKQGVKVDDSELREMLREVDESYLERKIEQQLTEKSQFQPKKKE